MSNRIKNVTSKVISNFWAKLEQVSFDFIFKDGRVERLTHEVYGKNDGVAVLLYNPSTKNDDTWPFYNNQFLILNIAMGGNLGGTIDPNFDVSTMEIDYVRVYQ